MNNVPEFLQQVELIASNRISQRGGDLSPAEVTKEAKWLAAYDYAGEIFDNWTQKDLAEAMLSGLFCPLISWAQERVESGDADDALDRLRGIR